MEKIYTPKPWTVERWKKIRKELWLLVLVVAALVFLDHFINALAWYFVHSLPPR